MNHHEQTKKSSKLGTPWAWVALGIVVGASALVLANQRRSSAAKAIGETLEDLFNLCENDCRDLETRISNTQLAS